MERYFSNVHVYKGETMPFFSLITYNGSIKVCFGNIVANSYIVA